MVLKEIWKAHPTSTQDKRKLEIIRANLILVRNESITIFYLGGAASFLLVHFGVSGYFCPV